MIEIILHAPSTVSVGRQNTPVVFKELVLVSVNTVPAANVLTALSHAAQSTVPFSVVVKGAQGQWLDTSPEGAAYACPLLSDPASALVDLQHRVVNNLLTQDVLAPVLLEPRLVIKPTALPQEPAQPLEFRTSWSVQGFYLRAQDAPADVHFPFHGAFNAGDGRGGNSPDFPTAALPMVPAIQLTPTATGPRGTDGPDRAVPGSATKAYVGKLSANAGGWVLNTAQGAVKLLAPPSTDPRRSVGFIGPEVTVVGQVVADVLIPFTWTVNKG